ncbi:hypothetical protein HY310_01370, partial [Candidatus Microgenomates bacterium]|nr:hypothetical protein [Candidatus Microgenomates bacterium]
IQTELERINMEMASTSARLAKVEQTIDITSIQSLVTSSYLDLATVSGDLKVVGLTQLANTNIGGELQVGMLHFDDVKAEISSLNGTVVVKGVLKAEEIQTDSLKVLGVNTTGSAILPAGQNSITIVTPNATDSAQILLTPRTLTDRVLTVISQKTGEFTVAIKNPETFDIKFNWFVVGTK